LKVLILCGGQGTRAYPYTRRMAKAMLPIAGLPVVEQVMRVYASQGFDEFVLSGGHLMEDIVRYFDDVRGWKVECVNTGDATDTAGRIRGCLDRPGDRFHATYCDGLGNVDLHALVGFHASQGGGATLTAYPLRSQYGVIHTDSADKVTRFEEKPVLENYWINAGFLVFEREAFRDVPGENLERDVLPELAERQLLHVFRHRGFWRSMDTYKDQQELDRLWGPYSAELSRRIGLSPSPMPDWLSEQYANLQRSPA
jgi:glucose-1-phosphate cytidylyltransferase